MSLVIRSLPKPNPQRVMDLGDPLNRYKWTIHNALFFSLTQPRTVQTVTDHCHDFLHDIGLKDPIASDNSGPAKGENDEISMPIWKCQNKDRPSLACAEI
jgi:hypothetical protein